MSDTTTGTGISQIGTVIVPVSDQDRAIEFFVQEVGFEKRSDTPFGNGDRWVEVAPPGASTTIAIATREGDPGRDRDPRRLGHRRRRRQSREHARAGSGRQRGGHAHGRPRAAHVILPRPRRQQTHGRRAQLRHGRRQAAATRPTRMAAACSASALRCPRRAGDVRPACRARL